MYPLISILIILAGILLFGFAGKLAGDRSGLFIAVKIASAVLIAAGLLLLYLLLSGTLTLPLSGDLVSVFPAL